MLKFVDDIRAIRQRDPAARHWLEVILCYPGFHAVFWHRWAHLLYRCHLKLLARITSSLNRFFTGVDIHPAAQVGRGLFIDHAAAVVIGETSIIGNNVTIYQGATLGGTGKDTGKRHPTIEDDVVISAGAKILGPLTIGKGSKVGAGAVVLIDVPPYSTVVGVPGKVVRRYDKPVDETADTGPDLDQTNLPDPVQRELDELRECVEKLQGFMQTVQQQENKRV
ncbi:serine O-acetyltransferase [Eubacteriales bacterium OttesenSCG-928-N14]|nr:serine O-acetyltransferase [Eubacteriales bacterium OttesenSCG-928-N14]